MQVLYDGEAKIFYLHFKPRASDYMVASEEKPLTILYSHGNAEDLGTCYERLGALACVVGADVVAYDYCGYGFSKSPGKRAPTEERVYEDADAMYTELTTRLEIPPHRIVLMGRSMGGGPACYLAQKYHSCIGGLVLLSTFTSCLGAVRCSWLRFFCVRDMFPNKEFLKHVTDCPVLIMHGRNDMVVPFSCAKQLLEIVRRAQKQCAKESMVSYHWFKGCQHNDIEMGRFEEFGSVLRDFVARVATHNLGRNPSRCEPIASELEL